MFLEKTEFRMRWRDLYKRTVREDDFMWVFSILFLISLLITIIGLFLLIPKKTRIKGKKLSISFLIICLISYSIARIGDNTESKSSDNTNHQNQSVSAPDEDKESDSEIDTSITKEQYNKIKIGMTIEEASAVLGKKPPKDYIVGFNGDERWSLDGENESSVDFNFDDNKLVEKSETGLLSSESNTITDKKGTRKFELTAADVEEQHKSDRYYEIESTLKSIIDKDFDFDTSLKKFELNDNLGTDEKADYVALIYLSYNQLHSAKTTKSGLISIQVIWLQS